MYNYLKLGDTNPKADDKINFKLMVNWMDVLGIDEEEQVFFYGIWTYDHKNIKKYYYFLKRTKYSKL